MRITPDAAFAGAGRRRRAARRCTSPTPASTWSSGSSSTTPCRNCRSRVTYKGALQGEGAHTVWVGDVLIRADAEGTDTYELNRNLVLTDGARADSVPNLEIETGEIAGAGHASATGRFDDEQLFYLQARGIPEDEARRLVVRGFFAELVQQIGVPDDRGAAARATHRGRARGVRWAQRPSAELPADDRVTLRSAPARSTTCPRSARSRVLLDGEPVAVVRDEDGEVHAIGDTCTHGDISLSEGEVEDCTIECWLHGSRFDLRTGEPTGLPAVRAGPRLPRDRRRRATCWSTSTAPTLRNALRRSTTHVHPGDPRPARQRRDRAGHQADPARAST